MAALAFIVGVIIMACANGYAVLMVGRFFVGLGVGFGLAVRTVLRGSPCTLIKVELHLNIASSVFRSIHCILPKSHPQRIVENW